NTLLTMIMNLLDIAKVDDGSLQLNLSPIDINSLVQERIVAIRPLADQKNLSIGTDLRSDLPLVQGDSEILQRVLANLLGNAISYSRDGGKILVKTSLEAKFVIVSICDEGRGIPSKYHQRIFEKFGQVRAGEGRRHGSTGLGLTFCKMAVEAHSGTIGVESEKDEGSEFFFSLPVS
ncbi:MAG: sensor histidine kinase, partial [Nitrospinota bacterium]